MQKGTDWKFILQGISVIIEHSLRRIGQEPPPEIVESTLEMDRHQKNHKIDPGPETNTKKKNQQIWITEIIKIGIVSSDLGFGYLIIELSCFSGIRVDHLYFTTQILNREV